MLQVLPVGCNQWVVLLVHGQAVKAVEAHNPPPRAAVPRTVRWAELGVPAADPEQHLRGKRWLHSGFASTYSV